MYIYFLYSLKKCFVRKVVLLNTQTLKHNFFYVKNNDKKLTNYKSKVTELFKFKCESQVPLTSWQEYV